MKSGLEYLRVHYFFIRRNPLSRNGTVTYEMILELSRSNNTLSPAIIRSLAASQDSNTRYYESIRKQTEQKSSDLGSVLPGATAWDRDYIILFTENRNKNIQYQNDQPNSPGMKTI